MYSCIVLYKYSSIQYSDGHCVTFISSEYCKMIDILSDAGVVHSKMNRWLYRIAKKCSRGIQPCHEGSKLPRNVIWHFNHREWGARGNLRARYWNKVIYGPLTRTWFEGILLLLPPLYGPRLNTFLYWECSMLFSHYGSFNRIALHLKYDFEIP